MEEGFILEEAEITTKHWTCDCWCDLKDYCHELKTEKIKITTLKASKKKCGTLSQRFFVFLPIRELKTKRF